MKSEGKGLRLHLTRKTDLAVRLLRALAGGARRTAADLASEVGSTATYLPHVMSPLIRAGWVESGAGPRGGYRLTVSLTDLSVLDVVEEIEGPTDTHCVMGTDCSDDDPCELHQAWASARHALREHLGNTPLASAATDLVADAAKHSPVIPTIALPGGTEQ